jgi:hypothetical protein
MSKKSKPRKSNPEGTLKVEDFYNDPEGCKEAGQHLKSVDDDGYCNGCGHQE